MIKAQTGPGAEAPVSAKATPQGRAESPAPSPRSRLTPRRLATLTTALLLIDDARIYGLIEDTGAYVDRHRCHRVLANLRHEGVRVDQDEVSGAVVELMAELGAVRA